MLHWNIALLYSITVTIHINDNIIFSVNLNIYFFFSSARADSEVVKRRLQWWWDRLIVFESQAKTWLDRTFLLQLFLLQPKISNTMISSIVCLPVPVRQVAFQKDVLWLANHLANDIIDIILYTWHVFTAYEWHSISKNHCQI